MTDVKGVCGEASKGVEGVRRDSELEEVRKEGDRRKMVEAVKDIEGKEVESRKEDEEDEEDEEPESSQEGDFEEFAKSIRGDVVTSSDDTAKYEEAKRIWNGDWKIKNEPKYIVHCRGVSDVQKCVNFARANKLPLTVRCGGHSLKGLSTCLNGMVIDLGKYMRSVRVQRRKMEVWFEGGCRVKDIDAETAAFNLCTVMGAVGSAGAGGLVTGGGLGYFARKEVRVKHIACLPPPLFSLFPSLSFIRLLSFRLLSSLQERRNFEHSNFDPAGNNKILALTRPETFPLCTAGSLSGQRPLR